MESFFATVKIEQMDEARWATRAEATAAIGSYLGGWYNPRRRHSTLDYRSPVAFERERLAPRQAA